MFQFLYCLSTDKITNLQQRRGKNKKKTDDTCCYDLDFYLQRWKIVKELNRTTFS